MSVQGISINPYDEVPFPSQPLPQSQPDRLAAVARLFGVDAPPVDRCRVLELGCATGGNIIPMADRFPESEYVGIDYSRAQVLIAERDAAQVQLSNLKLMHADIAQLDESLGKFDYIICHGVYSWVPEELQHKILELCRTLLTPNGLAYISYNVYPGWHFRMLLREAMCSHATGVEGPKARCIKGREALEFLVKAAQHENTPYAQMLKVEAEGILKLPNGYVYHEYFESDNRPLYFHEFVEQLKPFDLQYLGETAVATMFASNFGNEVENRLQTLAYDLVAGEQHLDVLRNRGFRQSIVCHANLELGRHITTQHLEGIHFYGRIAPVSDAPDLRGTGPEKFRASTGLNITTTYPILKAAMVYLNRHWPRAFTIDELLVAAAQIAEMSEADRDAPQNREALGQGLVKCMVGGLLEINSAPDSFVTTISERPLASRLARVVAQSGGRVTNRRLDLIDVNDSTRNILQFLDGQHDRQALLKELIAAVNRGDVSILVGGLPATQGEKVVHILEQTLDHSMQQLAANAILIG